MRERVIWRRGANTIRKDDTMGLAKYIREGTSVYSSEASEPEVAEQLRQVCELLDQRAATRDRDEPAETLVKIAKEGREPTREEKLAYLKATRGS